MSNTPAYHRLATYLLSLDGTVTVDGLPCSNKAQILAECRATGSASLEFAPAGGDEEKTEWAHIVINLDPEETVADMSCGGVIERWYDSQPMS